MVGTHSKPTISLTHTACSKKETEHQHTSHQQQHAIQQVETRQMQPFELTAHGVRQMSQSTSLPLLSPESFFAPK